MKISAVKALRALLPFAALLFLSSCTTDQDTYVEVHLTAPGMHCDGCTATVEETFAKMPGVDSVRADLASKDVYVHVDTALTSAEKLHDMIITLGFADPAEVEE